MSGSALSQSKDTVSNYKYWVSAGIWADREVTYNLNYSFASANCFYKAGYMRKGEHFMGGIGKDEIIFNTFDFSIGTRMQTKWFQASYFIGPSFLFGKQHLLSDEIVNYKTFGLQMETQLLFRPANEFGIGIGLYANVNLKRHYAGLNINVTLGNGK